MSSSQPPTSSRTSLPAIALSLALVVLGQLVLLVPWLGSAASALFPFGESRALPEGLLRAPGWCLGLILLLAGSLGLAMQSQLRAASPVDVPRPADSDGRWRLRGLPIAYPLVLGCLIALALIHEGSVISSTRQDRELTHLFGRWLLSLAAAALGLAAWDRWQGRSLKNPLSMKEWIGCSLLTLAVIALYSFDLSSYRYSFIGDEFAFFSVARDLVHGGKGWANVFSEDGIWGYHPRLSSFYQALVMRIFGVDNFGWRMSSVLAAAGCLLPCFIFLKKSVSSRAAWIGMSLLGLSHYSMTFAHLGYNNNQVLLPTFTCMAFLIWATSTGSALGYFLSGVAAGLGFYTFYTARLAVVFVAFFFALQLLRAPRRPWLPLLGCFLLGFLLTAGPAFARPGQLIENMRSQSVPEPAAESADEGPCWLCTSPAQATKLKRNVGLTLLSPIYFEANSHFVSGTLVDPVTASLFVIGLCSAALSVCRSTLRSFLIGVYLISALALGVSTPYESPPVSRMLFMVVPTVLLAAAGAEGLIALGAKWRSRWRWLAPGTTAALLLAMGTLNLHRVYVESPRDNGIPSQALVLKYLQRSPATTRSYYVLPDDWGADTIDLQFEIYKVQSRVEVLHFRDVRESAERLRAPSEVLFNEASREQRQELIQAIQARHPGSSMSRFTDSGAKNEMFVLRLP